MWYKFFDFFDFINDVNFYNVNLSNDETLYNVITNSNVNELTFLNNMNGI
jgi:hypothetical protein